MCELIQQNPVISFFLAIFIGFILFSAFFPRQLGMIIGYLIVRPMVKYKESLKNKKK